MSALCFTKILGLVSPNFREMMPGVIYQQRKTHAYLLQRPLTLSAML